MDDEAAAKEPGRRGKNIVVLSDGTGQEGGEGNNTNVYKLFRMIEDRTDEQIAFYDPGLGTGWRKLSGNAMGVGISQNVLDCYRFISDHYQWGDRIFLFGFSRGATTVRSLSGFIQRFGILPHSRPDLAKQAWRIYKIADADRRDRQARDLIDRNTTTWCNVDFLGVWDTVAALGIPNVALNALLDKVPGLQHSFHDLKISNCVQHARHAMSIDENRADFRVTPWHTEANGTSLLGDVLADLRRVPDPSSDPMGLRQTVKQVWFCGVHTDVGGGYKECGLSDVSLAWMIAQATDEAVMALYPLRLNPFLMPERPQDVDGLMHNPRHGRLKQLLFREGRRTWDPARGGRPLIHASVLDRKTGDTGGQGRPYKPWILDAFAEGAYDIEPWDQQWLPDFNLELEYRRGPG